MKENKRAKRVHSLPRLMTLLAPVTFGVGLIFLWLPGLILRLRKEKTSYEQSHANSSLNFQISLFLYILGIAAINALILLPAGNNLELLGKLGSAVYMIDLILLLLMALFALISYSFGAASVTEGKEFRYPLAIRFLK